MRDFTLENYALFLRVVASSSFSMQPLQDFTENALEKALILRHDVDRQPQNALKMARLEADAGIQASYYFRVVPEGWDEDVIQEIAALGHEIGYHYENLSTVSQKQNSVREATLFELALQDFEFHLDRLRQYYPVKTMCMHGSPASKWDNRELWKKYDYRKYDITCEPYFDLDFNIIFYITDAGRSWNNEQVSIRDKVASEFKIPIHSTGDIIALLQSQSVPSQIMVNIHPHNWAETPAEWIRIRLWQGMKNVVKRLLILKKKAI